VIIFRLESFRPPRECLVNLCEQAKIQGLLDTLPKGRGTSPFLATLRDIGRQHHPVLIIDDLSNITTTGIIELRKLKETWTILAALDTRHRHRAQEIFFGSHDVLELLPLSKAETRQLAEDASQDLEVPDKTSSITEIVNQSRGNPQILLDLVERARRTQQMDLDHPGIHKTLPATPFLSLFLLWACVCRYTASSLGKPDWKILLAIAIIVLSLVIIFDKILVKGSKL
jgi:hypothetical protein